MGEKGEMGNGGMGRGIKNLAYSSKNHGNDFSYLVILNAKTGFLSDIISTTMALR